MMVGVIWLMMSDYFYPSDVEDFDRERKRDGGV